MTKPAHTPTPLQWMTNDPVIARELRAIDRRYDRARREASALGFTAKIIAYRAAKDARESEWSALAKKLGAA